MPYPCSGCREEVRPRQEALSCDRCQRWRHRKCGTNISQAVYRDLNRRLRRGEDFLWTCPECLEGGNSDFLSMEDSTREDFNPVGNSTTITEETTPRHATVEDFNVDNTIEAVHHTEENSLTHEEITDIPADRPVTYTVVDSGTQKAKPRLHDSNGYRYTVKKKTARGTYWWCSVRSKNRRCPATVIQCGDEYRAGSQHHDHAGDPGVLLGTKVRVAVREKATTIKDQGAHQIVEQIMQDLRRPEDHQLPNPSYEARCLNRCRAAVRPAEPTSIDFRLDLEGCDVPSDFRVADLRVDGARHIVFATSEQLRLLADARVWYVDATFKVVRQPFYQLLSVHAFLRSGESIKQVPLMFCLMSRRRKEDYVAVLEAVKQALPSPADVDEVVADFEVAVWTAVRSVYPGVHIHGCTFHWCQAVYRHACQLGLRTAYLEKGAIYQVIKCILALPYLPRRHIADAFNQLRIQAGDSEQMVALCTYVSATWMESTVWGVGNWSGYRRLIRTNNDTEGWHRRLNSRAGRENLQLYVLLPLLLKEAKLVDLQLQLVAEHRLISSHRSRSSLDKQQRLHQLWNQYEEKEMTTSAFLAACAGYIPF